MSAIPTNPPKPPTTPREFLQDYSLYRELTGDKWSRPETISLDCPNCKKETTWATDGNDRSTLQTLALYTYQCKLCGKAWVYYLFSFGAGSLTKIGQQPRPSSRVPQIVARRLGASAEFYRKGLTNLNEGYGIAAVAYFRRVVEDKTNELIEVVADAAAAYSMPEKDVANLRAAKNEKVFEDKLKIASQAIPEVLKPDGANPLQALHGILSSGIHTQSEEECLEFTRK
jgi:hypothetical protein